MILPDLRQTGVRAGLAILEMAVAHGVQASLHNPAGPVLDAVSLQAAATVPGLAIMERQVNESPLYGDLCEVPLAPRDGVLSVPHEPGLGLSLDREALGLHAVGREDVPSSGGGGPNA